MNKKLLLTILFGLCGLLLSCSSQQSSADKKDVELLRKETELAKKEAELAKKELELSKQPTNSNVSNAISTEATPPPPKLSTVTIRFEPVWINGRGAGLFDPGMTAIVRSSAGKSSGKVNGRGVISIKGIPCDEEINIALPPTHGWGGATVYHRRFIKCGKPVVDLGQLKIGGLED